MQPSALQYGPHLATVGRAQRVNVRIRKLCRDTRPSSQRRLWADVSIGPANVHELKSRRLLRSTALPRDRRQDTELYCPSCCGPEVAGPLAGCRCSDKSGQPWFVAWNAFHTRSALDRWIEPNPSAFVHTAGLRCVVGHEIGPAKETRGRT